MCPKHTFYLFPKVYHKRFSQYCTFAMIGIVSYLSEKFLQFSFHVSKNHDVYVIMCTTIS